MTDILIEDLFLFESLDSEVTYFMTKDTDIPNRVNISFKIPDYFANRKYNRNFVVSIAKTTTSGVYKCDFYTVIGNRKFLNQQDGIINEFLSTYLKSVEKSIKILGDRVSALCIEIPAKGGRDYFKLSQLLLRRTSLNTKFKILPTDNTSEKSTFIFLLKNGKSIKDFNKNEIIKDEDLMNLKLFKPEKSKISLEQSAKYSFDDYNAEGEKEQTGTDYSKMQLGAIATSISNILGAKKTGEGLNYANLSGDDKKRSRYYKLSDGRSLRISDHSNRHYPNDIELTFDDYNVTIEYEKETLELCIDSSLPIMNNYKNNISSTFLIKDNINSFSFNGNSKQWSNYIREVLNKIKTNTAWKKNEDPNEWFIKTFLK